MLARPALYLAIALAVGGSSGVALGNPGHASGSYSDGDLNLTFSHVVVLDQDDAEGLLDSRRQLRVLLSDVPVLPAALHGIAFPPIRAMGRDGKVRGLLLEFDPLEVTTMRVTVLARPDDPAASLTSLTLSGSEGIWAALELTTDTVAGRYESSDDPAFRFSFAGPLHVDPVRADVRGPDAQQTEQMKILQARAEALGRMDMAAASALSSEAARATLAALPADSRRQIAASMPAALADLRASRRVIVRQASAVAILADGSWASLVLENGSWKVAD